MTQFSDDGKFYWDGTKWQPAISSDGAWRWNGTTWVVNSAAAESRWPAALKIGGWVLAGLGALVLVLAITSVIAFAVAASADKTYAPGYLGGGLVLMSLAILLAAPFGLRLAQRRSALTIGAIGMAVLFFSSCGGGIALTAAYPLPTPSPTPIAESRPGPQAAVKASQPPRTTSRPHPTASATSSEVPSPTPIPTPIPTATPTPIPVAVPTATPTAIPTSRPTPIPTATPPPPPPVVDLCGAPSNPWGYNFCGRGGLIRSPQSTFCSYFSPCVSTFWTATSGYVVQCVSGKWSHSGGVSGACSSNGGALRPLYSGP
jgi:hypothetical protein